MDYSLSDEEFYVLDCAAEEFGAFVLLAWLGTAEHQPARAAAIVERLLDRGLVDVAASHDFNPEPARVLAHEEALRAIHDQQKWRDARIEPFANAETYYVVYLSADGQAAWEREARRRAERSGPD
jgi:hypothetical protein